MLPLLLAQTAGPTPEVSIITHTINVGGPVLATVIVLLVGLFQLVKTIKPAVDALAQTHKDALKAQQDVFVATLQNQTSMYERSLNQLQATMSAMAGQLAGELRRDVEELQQRVETGFRDVTTAVRELTGPFHKDTGSPSKGG